jgi:uncharacterized DUF497 family protein
MNKLNFEWDDAKSAGNKRKHGVTFDEAESVFYDENAIEFSDPDHSRDEDRFLLVGTSIQLRVLVVCYCQRRGNFIRIITARRANTKEKKSYLEVSQ